MTISMFETRVMIQAIEQIYPPKTFFLDTFFNRVLTSNNEHVDVDVYKGGRQMAPFVNKNSESKTVTKRGYTTNSYRPPTIKMKVICDAYNLMVRNMGQHIYENGLNPSQKAEQVLGMELKNLKDMITRREEWMAASLLDSGKYTAVGEDTSILVDCGMPAAHRYTVSNLWTDALNGKPIADLKAASKKILKNSGLKPDIAILGEDTIEPFLERIGTFYKLDIRDVELGRIVTSDLAPGVTYLGKLAEAGGLSVYSYDEYYADDNGTLYEMMPKDRVFIGSTQAFNARHYGAIPDVESMAAVPFYPKTWIENDPSAMILSVQSGPLVAMHQPDAFASIKVV